MTVVFGICAAMLVVGAACAVLRAERGPSMLDRTVALDMFTTMLVGAIALEAAYSRRATAVPILVVMSLVAFVGSVTVARFAAVEREEEGHELLPHEVAAEEARRRALAERGALRAARRREASTSTGDAGRDDDADTDGDR